MLLSINFISVTSIAQNLNFEYITPDDGLSQSSVNSILQDKDGFMWFGTMNGLNKFDGYKFVRYYHNPDDSTSVASDLINCIFEDSKGKLWIGSDGGLSIFDRDQNIFENFKHLRNDTASLSGLGVSCIYEDSKGHIWVGTLGSGLNLYDREAKRFIHFTHNENDSNSVSSNYIRAITEDNDGGIWIATQGNGLNRLNPDGNSFNHFYHHDNDPTSLSYDIVYTLLKDKNGTIWVGTVGGGLCRIINNLNGKYTFENFKPNTNNLNRIRILSLCANRNNGIWIGTENGGLDYFDSKAKSFINYHVNDTTPGTLNNNSIHAIYEDRTGNLWVGTYTGGVNIAKKDRKRIYSYRKIPGNYNSLSYNAVSCFYEDTDGSLWIGTDGGGINIWDRETGKMKHVNSDNSSLKSNAILAICKDNDGDIWLGGWECGLNLYNKKTKAITTLSNEKDGIPNDNIFDILSDRKGRLWISFGGIGFAQYIKKTNTVILYNTTNSQLPSPWVLNLVEDFNGNIILGHTSGFSVFNPNDKTFENYSRVDNDNNSISNNQINIILPAHDSTLWIGTTNGNNHFDPKTKTFTRYYEQNGLPNNNITGLIEDDQGFVWISTANGISKYDPKSGLFKNYTITDGLQGKCFIRNSCFKTSDADILFGGTNGFNLFYPDSLFDNPNLPPIVFTDFTIFNKPVEIGQKGSPLNKHISQNPKVVLSYKQSVFSFEFAALDYTAPEQNQYAYKLDGFEKEWNYVATKRTATYTNLDPGDYVFRVKGSNNDGKWNDEGISLNITVTPPFWGTWWFRIMTLIISLSSLIGFYLIRINRFKKHKLRLEKLVAERTNEIERKNKTLYDQTQDLNESKLLLENRQKQIEEQSEKLSLANSQLTLLNATKDRFFSIIAHDLRNPFNNILGFIEILNDSDIKMEVSEIKDITKQLYLSATSTYNLLENLLEWSRTQSNNISFEPLNVEVGAICREVIEALTSNSKNVLITYLPTKEIFVKVDINMIKVVLRNLISNAIKFSHKNGVITINAEETDNNVTITVSDNGIGIKEENINKLFDFTQKFSSNGTAQEKGTGLGLIICKEFVEKHGGHIWVESLVGKGSDFKFTIPVRL